MIEYKHFFGGLDFEKALISEKTLNEIRKRNSDGFMMGIYDIIENNKRCSIIPTTIYGNGNKKSTIYKINKYDFITFKIIINKNQLIKNTQFAKNKIILSKILFTNYKLDGIIDIIARYITPLNPVKLTLKSNEIDIYSKQIYETSNLFNMQYPLMFPPSSVFHNNDWILEVTAPENSVKKIIQYGYVIDAEAQGKIINEYMNTDNYTPYISKKYLDISK